MTVRPEFETMRRAMVASQLRTSAVDDVRVIAAMDTVPREDFVPVAAQAQAYRDTGVAVGDGRALNPPIAKPGAGSPAAARAAARRKSANRPPWTSAKSI